jgi:hypothetical protein
MKRRVFRLVTIGLLSSIAAAEPATTPTTQPTNVWTASDFGRLILRPFATAPYPHASRADGWKNSAGSVFTPDHYADSTVGLFVPEGYTPGDAVDLVVYFHGHKNHVSRVIDTFKLEGQIAKAGVNAILVVPQGPLDVPDSGGGKLERDDGGFARFVTEVAAYLKAEGVTRSDHIGTIALAAHSGGYQVTASILHRGGLTDRITDVILLDASYGGLQWFADFAKARPDARIMSFHTKHLDDENIELAALLDKAGVDHRDVAETDLSSATLAPAGVTFISTTLAHDDVPSAKDYLSLCLRTSHLASRPATQPVR